MNTVAEIVRSAKNTSSQVFTTSTLTLVTDLSLSVVTSFGYWFKFVISYSVGASSGFPQVGITFPTTPTYIAAHVRFTGSTSGAVTGDSQGDLIGGSFATSLAGSITSGTNFLGIVEGILVPSQDGTLQLRFAKPISGPSNVTINAYSTLVMRRIF